MKKGLKKALGLLVALSLMVVGSAFSALAADSPEQRQTFSVDLNNFERKPALFLKHYISRRTVSR